jgi:hypothetical protein
MIGVARNQFINGAGTPFDTSFLNYIQSGLVLPTSGTIASLPVMTAGVAYIEGVRVQRAATSLSLTAMRDNYIDITRNGLLSIQAVVIGSAAPAIPVNGMRIGFITTDATSVTSATTGTDDNAGNWMGNISAVPACKLIRASASGYAGAAVALPFPDADAFDNALMHNPSTDNTRIIFPSNGTYFVDCLVIWFIAVTPGISYSLEPRLNGGATDGSFTIGYQGTQATQAMRSSGLMIVRAGDYMEMIFNPSGASGAVNQTRLNVTRVQ